MFSERSLKRVEYIYRNCKDCSGVIETGFGVYLTNPEVKLVERLANTKVVEAKEIVARLAFTDSFWSGLLGSYLGSDHLVPMVRSDGLALGHRQLHVIDVHCMLWLKCLVIKVLNETP